MAGTEIVDKIFYRKVRLPGEYEKIAPPHPFYKVKMLYFRL